MKKLLTLLLIPTLFIMTACSSKEFNQLDPPEKGDEIGVITTDKGVIKIRFFDDKAPKTVKNFKELAKDGKYNGTIFHRVIKDFMIQGGDIENKSGGGGHTYKGPGTTLPDEIAPELKHLEGAVSMANKGPGTETGGSQFFIVHPEEGVDYLDGGYAVFGQVFEGMDVVDAIAKVETSPEDKPVQDVVVEKVEIIEYQPE